MCRTCDPGYFLENRRCRTCDPNFSLENGICKRNTCDETTSRLMNPPELSRSYSSVYGNQLVGTGHARSMIDSAQAWSAGHTRNGEWLLLDLESDVFVGGLAMQGRGGQWVKTYSIQYWLDGESLSDAKDVEGGFVFTVTRSYNSGEEEEIYFETGVLGRYFRILPQSWASHISMRAGLMVCD